MMIALALQVSVDRVSIFSSSCLPYVLHVAVQTCGQCTVGGCGGVETMTAPTAPGPTYNMCRASHYITVDT